MGEALLGVTVRTLAALSMWCLCPFSFSFFFFFFFLCLLCSEEFSEFFISIFFPANCSNLKLSFIGANNQWSVIFSPDLQVLVLQADAISRQRCSVKD